MAVSSQVKTHKITQPYQLIATLVIGMVFIIAEFISASLITQDSAQRIIYTWSSIGFSLLFLLIIFLLQTVFRETMQDNENFRKMWIRKRNDEVKKNSINLMEDKVWQTK